MENSERSRELVDRVVRNIQRIIREKDLVLAQVLEEADVNAAYLNNLLSEKSRGPTITKLQQIADALNEPLTSLLLEGDMSDARNQLLRIADRLQPQQLELLVATATALIAQASRKPSE